MPTKTAIIICSPDAYANAVKPKKIKEFLEVYDFDVKLFSTNSLSRMGDGMMHWFPGFGINKFLLYCLEAIHLFGQIQKSESIRRLLVSRVTLPMMRLRATILHTILVNHQFDVLICESNMDIGIVAYRHAAIQILDLPSPFAEELFYGNGIDEKHYVQLKNYETSLYAEADHLSFHWYTYANFVKKEKYNGSNFIDLGYGTTSKTARALYSESPKIIFLGLLEGYWVNLPLLEELTKLYPHIDVYGGPAMPNAKINYKGYAPTLDVLAEYQFGLITISDDILRQNSFSSKQLEYFSYGLPVFTPDWRKDTVLGTGSIYYNADNFVSLIEQFSDKVKWEEKSTNSVEIAHRLSWTKVLEPLGKIVQRLN